ncbi:MAG: AbrB/MazE/SpoVT family DNA-binding domain-containing protein [Nitrospiraceae bacterium]|nr:AbrB/MazE/SpoVT family DNA-binding domain-containing protein [Nitrospiraceae bacterium]
MTVTAKITSKGQITLPKKVRDLLHLHEGGVVVFEQEDDKMVIKSAESLLDYQGYLKGRAKPADADAVRETARKYVGRKAGRRRE